jgi:hypothetical protein
VLPSCAARKAWLSSWQQESHIPLIKLSIATLGVLIFALVVHAQVFEHQFQEPPTPDANVIVISKWLRLEADGYHSVSGRVFNRGLKPAKNVRVVFAIRDLNGVILAQGSVPTLPDEIPATSYADFRQKLLWRVDPREVTFTATPEWSQ